MASEISESTSSIVYNGYRNLRNQLVQHSLKWFQNFPKPFLLQAFDKYDQAKWIQKFLKLFSGIFSVSKLSETI